MTLMIPALRPAHRTQSHIRIVSAGGATAAASTPLLRVATGCDLDALSGLERSCFDGDRISRRGWSRLLKAGTAQILVVEGQQNRLGGALVLLFHRNRSIARIYSLAIDPAERQQGYARALLRQALLSAEARDCDLIRLETRIDNLAAQCLFLSEGFSAGGTVLGYYQDGMDALRFERSLWQGPAGPPPSSSTSESMPIPMPYFGQTLNFTCGPAALMMAMAALDPAITPERRLEIRLWREATTVFMAAGHGGCGPYGLALAAYRRGFAVTIHKPAGPMFLDSVRDRAKKEVIALVEEDMRTELATTDVVIKQQPVSVEILRQALARGALPLVMIGLYRLHGMRAAHWVVLTGYDGHVFRFHDPLMRGHAEEPALSISARELERIYRYGRNRETAAVILARKP